MVVLDTSVIIDHLRQPAKKSQLIKAIETLPEERFALSVVSIQELYEGKSTKNESRETDLLTTLTKIEILPYTYEVASMAGKIARDLGRPIELADAAIAAVAVMNKAQLFTLNRKDFAGITDLKLLEIS